MLPGECPIGSACEHIKDGPLVYYGMYCFKELDRGVRVSSDASKGKPATANWCVLTTTQANSGWCFHGIVRGGIVDHEETASPC